MIHVISTGYNCAEYIDQCHLSVVTQVGVKQPFKHWMLSDGSTDETSRYNPIEGHYFEHVETNRGAMWARDYLIHEVIKPDKDDIIVLLGLDDYLKPDALQTIEAQHDQGYWVTYGNWINQHGVVNSVPVTLPNKTREGAYNLTAPNSFRAGLYYLIPADRFQIEGQYPMVCTEVEVMYSCCELAGWDRVKPIKTHIYVYRMKLPNGTIRRFGQGHKNRVHEIIKKRERLLEIKEY